MFSFDTRACGGEADVKPYTSVTEIPPTHQYNAHSGMTLFIPFLVTPSLKRIYIFL